MPDPIAKAFLSYAHLDNDREGGRILRLADLIKNEYGLLTGSEIEIFTDDSNILWGDDWRAKIEEALQETTFFIPVLTPSYFVRDECRREMTRFTATASALQLPKTLLSIRYIPVPDLRDDSVDDLKARAARMQYESWDGLRLLSEDSPEHRQAINRLAARLVELTQDFETGDDGDVRPSGSAALVPPSRPFDGRGATPGGADGPEERGPEPSVPEDDDGDGPMDVLVDAQSVMDNWAATLQSLPVVTNRFNDKFRSATERMNAANSHQNAFAHKVQIARVLAADVEPELSEIEELSKEYSEGVARADRVFRALYELAGMGADEDAADQLRALNAMVQELVTASVETRRSLARAADAARVNARLSKDLRPVLRRFETAVRNIIDGSTLIDSWGELAPAGPHY